MNQDGDYEYLFELRKKFVVLVQCGSKEGRDISCPKAEKFAVLFAKIYNICSNFRKILILIHSIEFHIFLKTFKLVSKY